ncbi:MAG: NAD(P)/FAD-dependent oxidoreductase [Proteobacteria bacterium]|nr:NAD(P)/FAD-dependent oxidoreductase [Pseudomonadota bacterium]
MSEYDVVVVGAGIAGLGVAGLLQSAGVRTLVLEKGRTPGGRARTYDLPGGWRLDSGTHCVDLGTESACARLLERVGRTIEWTRPMEGIRIFKDGAWMSQEEFLGLSEEESGELNGFLARLKDMPDAEIDELDTVSLSDFLAGAVRSDKVTEFLKMIGMVQTTLSEAENISAGEFAAIYREALRQSRAGGDAGKVRMPVGGIGVMTGAQAQAALDKGAEIRYSTPVRRVEPTGAGGFRVILDGEEISAPAVVMALPIWNLVKMLPMEEDSPLPRAWRERMKGLVRETSASIGYTTGLTGPIFTGPVYLSAWRVPEVGLPLQIFGQTNFDASLAPPGHMIAFIGTPCTPDQAENEAWRENTLAVFWKTLEQMFPGIGDKVVWNHPGWAVGIDGLGRSPGLTGRYRPKVFLEEMPGLYFAGDCYTGRGVGMNAAANSAMICAEKILADLKAGGR